MRTSTACSFFLVVPLAVLFACVSTVPATVTRRAMVPMKKGPPIFLVAQAQRARILKSLSNAGLQVSEEWSGEGYWLAVRIGNSRAGSNCGTTNNIAYVLNNGPVRLLVIKGRGKTGRCIPNVFDDMSRTLAGQVGGG